MIARCARCQGTFTTDRFGLQSCPHCGSELHLADPSAPAGGPPPPPPPAGPVAPAPPAWGAPPPPPGMAGPPPPPPAIPPGPGAPPPPGSFGAPPAGGLPPPPPYGPPGYGPPAGDPGGQPAPFAERDRRGFFHTFFETFKLVAVQPADFFRRVRVDQTGSAVLFGVIASSVGTIASAIYSYLSSSATLAALQEMTQNMPEEQVRFLKVFMQGMSGGVTLGQIILAPLFAVIGIYLSAGIIHLALMLFRGAHRGFDTTLTVAGYAAGLHLLLALPGCGSLVSTVWWLVVMIIGLGEAQRCGSGKGAAAVLAPAILFIICCCSVVGLTFGTLMGSMKGLLDAAKGQGSSL